MKSGIYACLCGLAMAALAQSCFTGIESTPRITNSEARRAGVKPTDEGAFATLLLPESPRSWQPGKQWLVTDDKINMLFLGSPSGTEHMKGSVITLSGISPVVSLTGDSVVELQFSAPGIAPRLRYTTDIRTIDWPLRPSLSIPFTVELSAVSSADSLMRGRRLYILSALWCDQNGESVRGLHHIPVEITGVRAGTEALPLMVSFRPIDLGNDIPQQYIYMTYGTGYAASRNFDRIFSFTNPREKYPNISNTNWDHIVRSQVAAGMTRNEVRLSLGNPDNIDRGATRGGMQIERWSYSNGMYLIFEEDFLIRAGR